MRYAARTRVRSGTSTEMVVTIGTRRLWLYRAGERVRAPSKVAVAVPSAQLSAAPAPGHAGIARMPQLHKSVAQVRNDAFGAAI